MATQTPTAPGRGGSAKRRFGWTRLLLSIAVIAPALAIGGGPPIVVVGVCGLVLALIVRIAQRDGRPLPIPLGLGALLIMAAWTALAAVWLPPALGSLLAPELARIQTVALGEAATRISVLPGATGLEVARLLALAGLFWAASTVSWRISATAVMLAGTAVALVGVAHELLGASAILGFYTPVDLTPERAPAFVTTFVNPNHQASLFCLGSMAALGLTLDSYERAGSESGSGDADRGLVALACFAMQLVALLLSLSRGALIALVLVTPVTLILVLRRRGEASLSSATRRRALLILVAAIMLALVVGRLGAWEQLSSLWTDNEVFEHKLTAAVDALELIGWSPIVGIGRGATVDLLPAVQTDTRYSFTHIESAPLTFVVEWGPIVGGLALLAVLRFLRLTWRTHDDTARRIVLLGLVAVTLHNLAEFSWELLGVAAPAVAIAGSLAPSTARELRRVHVRRIGVPLVGLALILAVFAYPRTRSGLRELPRALESGELSAADALARRPLDPRVHASLASADLESGERSRARVHAELASRFGPTMVGPELLLAAIARREGRPADMDQHLRRGLARVREPLDEELARWLIERLSPAELAAVAPSEDPGWSAVSLGLLAVAPDYADSFAAHYDEGALAGAACLIRAQANLARGHPALALHHARLGSQAAPARSKLYLLQLEALRSLGGPKTEASVAAVLDEALTHELDDPAIIEEAFVINAILTRNEDRLMRAADVVESLVARPGSASVRARRRELARRLELARR